MHNKTWIARHMHCYARARVASVDNPYTPTCVWTLLMHLFWSALAAAALAAAVSCRLSMLCTMIPGLIWQAPMCCSLRFWRDCKASPRLPDLSLLCIDAIHRACCSVPHILCGWLCLVPCIALFVIPPVICILPPSMCHKLRFRFHLRKLHCKHRRVHNHQIRCKYRNAKAHSNFRYNKRPRGFRWSK